MISKRGRKSKADIEARVIEGRFGKRPEPPEELTERQAEIWRETIASELAELISTAATRAILADYCPAPRGGREYLQRDRHVQT
jgi:hypothetical protein